MAQPDGPQSEPPSEPQTTKQRFLKRLFGSSSTSSRHQDGSSSSIDLPPSLLSDQSEDGENGGAGDPLKPSNSRRAGGAVVPGLPRAQTFKRRLSESRAHLAPVQPSIDERRAVSMDRRENGFRTRAPSHRPTHEPGDALFGLGNQHENQPLTFGVSSMPHLEGLEEHEPENSASNDHSTDHTSATPDTFSDTHSISDSEYEAQIRGELEKRWILNLSMHFKDHSRREKFFVTYRQDDNVWRRVTVSLDYRNAPPNSLEMDLIHTKFQRDKNQKIFESIRESLPDIHFFDTVTNLKLETTDGRLHVHVVEDGNEIIPYPPLSQVAHLGCRRIRESEIEFHSHMSGFVYKVAVDGEILIKKEIPSPETIEEFLYEINALNSLGFSDNVINFHGVVVDDSDEYVKGLLISFADGGALIDVIYDNCKDPNGRGLAWSVRERWARQIVHGLADIHESGFVQGDFTLSNIVIDHNDDAKIIDINRRGCPVGWEPPEATPLLESNHRISMYIGNKSDLYQLGMVLWALAMEDDEPDLESRPLGLGPDAKVPEWYRVLTETCLNPDPRRRLQACQLTQMFPPEAERGPIGEELSSKGYYDESNTVRPPSEWSHYDPRFTSNGAPSYEPWNYAPRGRSPPSPLPSNPDTSDSHRDVYSPTAWAARRFIRPSYSDAGVDDFRPDDMAHNFTPTPTAERIDFPEGELRLDEDEADEHLSAEATPTQPKGLAPLSVEARNDTSPGPVTALLAPNSAVLQEISPNIQKKEPQETLSEGTKHSGNPGSDAKDGLANEGPDEDAVKVNGITAPKEEEDVQVVEKTETTQTELLDETNPQTTTPEMDSETLPKLESSTAEDTADDNSTVKATTIADSLPTLDTPPTEISADKPDHQKEEAKLVEDPEAAAQAEDDPKTETTKPLSEARDEAGDADLDKDIASAKDQLKIVQPSPVADGQKEDPSGDSSEADPGKGVELPVQQPETTEKEELKSEDNPSVQLPEPKSDERPEAESEQQEKTAIDDGRPGKLEVSELVNGGEAEEVPDSRISDSPNDSSPPKQ